MASYEQNVRTLSLIQQRRDSMTPPDRWEEEQVAGEQDDDVDRILSQEYGRFSC